MKRTSALADAVTGAGLLRRVEGLFDGIVDSARRVEMATGLVAAAITGLVVASIAQGAFALVGLGAFVVALYLPAKVLIGVILLVRNLTDPATGSEAAGASSQGASLNALIGVGVILATGLRLLIRRERAVGLGWAATIVVLMTGWYILAVLQYGNEPSLLREFVRVISIVAMGVLAVTAVRTAEDGRQLAWLVVLATVIPAVFALLQMAGVISTGGTAAGRARGTFTQANAAATYFSISLTLAVWLAMTATPGRRRLPVAAAACFAICLLGTKSLGGIADGLISVLVLAVMSPTGRRVKQGAAAATVLLVAIFVVSPLGAERVSALAETQGFQAAQEGKAANSLDWRFRNWNKLVPYFERYPAFGNGLGTTNEIINPIGKRPHSDLVRILVEAGIVGLLAFGFLGFRLIRRLFEAKKAARGSPSLATPALAVLAGTLVQCLDETVSTNTTQMFTLAVVLTAAMIILRRGSGEPI